MRGRHTSTPARSGPEGVVMSAHRSIVVGVDGSDASLEAVVWGAREAALRNAVLSLVTTVPGRGFAGIPVGAYEAASGEPLIGALVAVVGVAAAALAIHKLTRD